MNSSELKETPESPYLYLSRVASWQRSMVWAFLMTMILLAVEKKPMAGIPEGIRAPLLSLLTSAVLIWFCVTLIMVNSLVYSKWAALPLTVVALFPILNFVWWYVTSRIVRSRLRAAGVNADFWWTSEDAIQRAFKRPSGARPKPTPAVDVPPSAPPPPSRDLSAPL